MFEKIDCIKKSERVFDLVKDELEQSVKINKLPIDGYLETFNNDREQGYVLVIVDDYLEAREKRIAPMYFWVTEYKSSDSIVVYSDTSSNPNYTMNYKCTDFLYTDAKFFGSNDYYEAAKYIVNLIEKKTYKIKKI